MQPIYFTNYPLNECITCSVLPDNRFRFAVKNVQSQINAGLLQDNPSKTPLKCCHCIPAYIDVSLPFKNHSDEEPSSLIATLKVKSVAKQCGVSSKAIYQKYTDGELIPFFEQVGLDLRCRTTFAHLEISAPQTASLTEFVKQQLPAWQSQCTENGSSSVLTSYPNSGSFEYFSDGGLFYCYPKGDEFRATALKGKPLEYQILKPSSLSAYQNHVKVAKSGKQTGLLPLLRHSAYFSDNSSEIFHLYIPPCKRLDKVLTGAKKLRLDQKVSIARQLLNGLLALHTLKIAHKALTTEAVYITDDGMAYIGNFDDIFASSSLDHKSNDDDPSSQFPQDVFDSGKVLQKLFGINFAAASRDDYTIAARPIIGAMQNIKAEDRPTADEAYKQFLAIQT